LHKETQTLGQLPSSSYNHTTLTTFRTFVRRHYKCTSKLQ